MSSRRNTDLRNKQHTLELPIGHIKSKGKSENSLGEMKTKHNTPKFMGCN